MAHLDKLTTDHEEIKRWVEDHDGRPVAVNNGHERALRVIFPDQGINDYVEEISWEEWFREFDARDAEAAFNDDEDRRFFRVIES